MMTPEERKQKKLDDDRRALERARGRNKGKHEALENKEKTAPDAAAIVELVPIKRLKPNPINAEFFRPLPDDEKRELAADIEAHGIRDPLHAMPDGMLLTGHNRLAIAKKLQLKVVPVIRSKQIDETAQTERIISDNLRRRHLSQEERRALIAKLIELYPDASNRQIAAKSGTHHATVASVRGDVDKSSTSIDTKGRPQSRTKPNRPKNPPTASPPGDVDNLSTSATTADDPGQDFHHMADADKANRGKGPVPFATPQATLARLLNAALERAERDDLPGTIARELVAELKKAGLV